MKISVDTLILYGQGMPFRERYALVADMGFEYISLCDMDFPGGLKRPKVTREDIVYHQKLLEEHHLKVASFVTGFPISSPDEYWREAGVRAWKRMLEIGEEMGVTVFNTELGGDVNQPNLCEEQLMRSLDELVPMLEARGMRMEFQAHPNDFYETHKEALGIIKYYDTRHLGYLYAIPHSFYYDKGKGNVGKMLKDSEKYLTHVIFADTYNHTIPWRYNINPMNSTARVHAHIGVDKGDINWKECFDALREIGFAEREDTIACVTLFGFPELFRQEASEFRQRIEKELLK